MDETIRQRTLKVWLAELEERLAQKDEKANESAQYAFCEMLICIAGDYANHILTPRIFAERRRRAGDSSASPRDYDCECPVKGPDGVPNCNDRLPGCKFAAFKRPRGYYNHDNAEWFDIHQRERKRIVAQLRNEPERIMDELSGWIGN